QATEFEARGNKLQANNLYAEARWAFIHVIAQFFDNDEYVAGANFFAGKCYDKLQDVEKSDALSKAIQHWQLVVQNFPKSSYKDMAVAELTRVGAPVPKVEQSAAPAPAPAAPAAGKAP